MRKLVVLLRWIFGLPLTIIGLAGIPGNIKIWREEWIPMLDFLDPWPARLVLALSGIAAITYPQWISAIQGWKNRDRVDHDLNVDSGDRSITKVRRLLSEAAAGLVDTQPNIDIDDVRASARFGAFYGAVLRFLEMSFMLNYADDMRHYVQSRRTDPKEDAEVMASFLKDLEGKITSDELDPKFLIPYTFDEFVKNHENWPRHFGNDKITDTT